MTQVRSAPGEQLQSDLFRLITSRALSVEGLWTVATGRLQPVSRQPRMQTIFSSHFNNFDSF
jgi:hypothetical protein